MQAKHAAEAAVAAERVASRTGDPKAKAAAEAAAKKAAELATLAAQTKGNVKLGNGDLLVVVIGQAPAPKYTTLSKGADGVSWSFPPNWKLGLVNAGDGNNKPPPRICTSGLFGGAAFPAVSSGSPGGLTICGTHRQRHSSSDATHTLTTPLPPSCSAHITGTGDGRLFFFDLLHSAAALGQMDAQHDGNAVTSICLVPSSTGGGVSSLATGAIDGSIHLWEVRGGGGGALAAAASDSSAAPSLVKMHSYRLHQRLKQPKPALIGAAAAAAAAEVESDSEEDYYGDKAKDLKEGMEARNVNAAIVAASRQRPANLEKKGPSVKKAVAVPLPQAGFPLPPLADLSCGGAIRCMTFLPRKPTCANPSGPLGARASMHTPHTALAIANARGEQRAEMEGAVAAMRKLKAADLCTQVCSTSLQRV